LKFHLEEKDVREKCGDVNNYDYTSVITNLATSYQLLKDYEKSLENASLSEYMHKSILGTRD
jgi:hypothetical protein